MKCTLILSLVMMLGLFLMLYAGVAFIQNKKYFTSAPRDIWEAIEPHNERFKGQHFVGYILFALSIFMLLGEIVFGAYDRIKNEFTLIQFFVRFTVMFLLLKVFDILFFDLFLLTNSHFYQHYYPETEGCKGFSSLYLE